MRCSRSASGRSAPKRADGLAGSLAEAPPRGGHPHEGAAAVGGVRLAAHEVLGFELVDELGDAGGVGEEALADLGDGQGARSGEGEEHEHLVAGEGEAEGLEGPVDRGGHDLLGADDRGRRGHRERLVEVVDEPLPSGLDDRVERGRPLAGRSSAWRAWKSRSRVRVSVPRTSSVPPSSRSPRLTASPAAAGSALGGCQRASSASGVHWGQRGGQSATPYR